MSDSPVNNEPAPMGNAAPPIRLLILACSQRKLPDAGDLPALERYDGPSYRVLRRYLRHTSAPDVAVLILSARYGIITADTPVPWYDQRMTASRVAALQTEVERAVAAYLNTHTITASCICMGQDYRAALGTAQDALKQHSRCTVISGSIGGMLAGLHNWLYPLPPRNQGAAPLNTPRATPPQLRGITITLTGEQVLERARQARAQGQGDPSRYQAWYVLLDGQRVSPKWVVSVISSIPVGGFSSGDARRVLQQLGVEVHRI